MKARALIGSATYDPATLKILFKAFDDAWDQIAPSVSSRPEAIEATRIKLANIVMGLVQDGGRIDAVLLRDAALELMHTPPTEL